MRNWRNSGKSCEKVKIRWLQLQLEELGRSPDSYLKRKPMRSKVRSTRLWTTQCEKLKSSCSLEAPAPLHHQQVTSSQRLESLKKGREAIAERQKLIKIADRSELGWAVVNEYTADELADNSDDEKRMEKAEKAAERKAARKRKAPAEKSKASKRSASAMVPVQTYQPHPSAQFQLPFVRRAPAQQSTPKLPGPCFTCGQIGHLKSYCPKTQASSSKTVWYPPLKVHSDTGFVCSMELEHVDNVCTGSSENAGMPAVDESEAPSEVHSEGESYVLSPCDQTLGAASGANGLSCQHGTHAWGNGRCAW